MDLAQLEQALLQLPEETLLTEIPEVQNSIQNLLRSNNDMREFDPELTDPDFATAIKENEALIQRLEARIDLTLKVIQTRLGDAAAREVGSNVTAFRQQHPTQHLNATVVEEEGIYL